MITNLTDIDLVVLTRALGSTNARLVDQHYNNDFNALENDREYALFSRLADECLSRGINYHLATKPITRTIIEFVKIA